MIMMREVEAVYLRGDLYYNQWGKWFSSIFNHKCGGIEPIFWIPNNHIFDNYPLLSINCIIFRS